ncbi:MAG: hypothetical protein KBS74_03965 [Clostridiales bacterium]|nr:hypothetical protein [Candidatus Cacconaster stercorequi]
MWKALLKKQFLELNTFYFQNRKTGKRRTKAGLIGYAILYVLLFGFVAVAFFAMGIPIAAAVVPAGMDWLYFAMMGMIAILLGVFGDVFNTYAGLYRAKDNELLLSMPIPPSKILLVRMVGVYAMGLLYSGLVFVPAAIAFWVFGRVTVANVICPIIMLFIIAAFVTALSCVLGWVVALISGKLKNKSFVTVLASLAFIGLYYVVYFRISSYLQAFATHVESIGHTIESVAYPFYAMGRGAAGHIPSLLLFTAIVAVLFALICYVMARNFIKIATMKGTGKKSVYKEQTVKTVSVKGALLRKELRRFLSSPTYMLNCGLGIVIMPVLAVVALIRMKWLREMVTMLTAELPEFASLLPLAALVTVCLTACMNDFTAPSVSLEGKNIWIVQSLPVSAAEVLDAKRRLGTYLSLIPTVLCTVVLGIVLQVSSTAFMYMLLAAIVFVMFYSAWGLMLNLRHPNLTWTNEVVPIKQSASVAIALFGGWAMVLVIGAGGYFLRNVLDPELYILCVMLLLAVLTRLVNKWLFTKGAEIFETL